MPHIVVTDSLGHTVSQDPVLKILSGPVKNIGIRVDSLLAYKKANGDYRLDVIYIKDEPGTDRIHEALMGANYTSIVDGDLGDIMSQATTRNYILGDHVFTKPLAYKDDAVNTTQRGLRLLEQDIVGPLSTYTSPSLATSHANPSYDPNTGLYYWIWDNLNTTYNSRIVTWNESAEETRVGSVDGGADDKRLIGLEVVDNNLIGMLVGTSTSKMYFVKFALATQGTDPDGTSTAINDQSIVNTTGSQQYSVYHLDEPKLFKLSSGRYVWTMGLDLDNNYTMHTYVFYSDDILNNGFTAVEVNDKGYTYPDCFCKNLYSDDILNCRINAYASNSCMNIIRNGNTVIPVDLSALSGKIPTTTVNTIASGSKAGEYVLGDNNGTLWTVDLSSY